MTEICPVRNQKWPKADLVATEFLRANFPHRVALGQRSAMRAEFWAQGRFGCSAIGWRGPEHVGAFQWMTGNWVIYIDEGSVYFASTSPYVAFEFRMGFDTCPSK